MKNYYSILALEPDATPVQIKKSFRVLARQYHPDVNPNDPAAEEKFKDVNEAYQILGNEKSKKKYDDALEAQQQTSGKAASENAKKQQQESDQEDGPKYRPTEMEVKFNSRANVNDFYSQFMGYNPQTGDVNIKSKKKKKGPSSEFESYFGFRGNPGKKK